MEPIDAVYSFASNPDTSCVTLTRQLILLKMNSFLIIASRCHILFYIAILIVLLRAIAQSFTIPDTTESTSITIFDQITNLIAYYGSSKDWTYCAAAQCFGIQCYLVLVSFSLKKWKMFVIQLIWWISMISYQIAALLTDAALNNSAALITLTIVANGLDATAKILTLLLFIFPFITQSIHLLNPFSTMLMGCTVAIQLMAQAVAEVPFVKTSFVASQFPVFYAASDLLITLGSIGTIALHLAAHNSFFDFLKIKALKSRRRDITGFFLSFLGIIILFGLVLGNKNQVDYFGIKNIYGSITALKLYYLCKISQSVLEGYDTHSVKEIPIRKVFSNLIPQKIWPTSKKIAKSFFSKHCDEQNRIPEATISVIIEFPENDQAANSSNPKHYNTDKKEEERASKAFQGSQRQLSELIQKQAASNGNRKELELLKVENKRLMFVFGSDEIIDQNPKIRRKSSLNSFQTLNSSVSATPQCLSFGLSDDLSDALSSDDDYDNMNLADLSFRKSFMPKSQHAPTKSSDGNPFHKPMYIFK